MTTLALAGVVITLVSLTVWLLLREGRARGKAQAATQAAITDTETAADVADIQSRPIPSRNAVLDRMRGQYPP